ncbi:hypothetical protein B7494_g2839 [Chlorociboria aeruginascens]|nr:hypothetical protein B7494_g2839 [Chlorociboria aeruginascens]
MPANPPVALILGAGSRVGHHVGRAFAAKGYKIALAARSLKEDDSTPDQLQIQSDFSDLNSVIEVFAKVKSQLGLPSVVVYNAAAVTQNDAKNPLSLALEDFDRDLRINTSSAFIAAQQAVLAFENLPESASRTFIYTGNILNTTTMASLLDLGVGKSATAHIIESAAKAYQEKGYKFYYADERKPDGSAAFGIDGPAHGMRCVPQEEDSLRANDGRLFAMHQIQNTLSFYPYLGKKKTPKTSWGLEDRLARMESLLKITEERDQMNEEPSRQSQSDAIDLRLGGGIQDQRGIQRLSVTSQKLAGGDGHGTSQILGQDLTVVRKPLPVGQHSPSTLNGCLVRDVVPHRTFHELPSESSAVVLIDEAFQSFIKYFPIFDQQSFMQLFHDHYSGCTPNDPGWWACVNVVLALAHRFRAMRTFKTEHENKQACNYMHNAVSVVSELTMLHNSLPAIQALLGMTIVLQGTPNPWLCSVLLAAALKLAQTMGLHRHNQNPSLAEWQIEERKNVFWIIYILDKDISLRAGHPPAQDDDDMDVELPSRMVSNLPLTMSGVDTISFFDARIRLAVIQGRIYKKLYSVKATRQSHVQKLAATRELDIILRNWRSTLSIDFEENEIIELGAPITAAILHIIILRMSYVKCMIILHLPSSLGNNPTINALLGLQDYVLCPESIDITEARKAIRLIQIIPKGDYACTWLLISDFFAVVNILLQNILISPADPQAHSDLLLIEPFLQLLQVLSKEGKSEEVQKMYESCTDLGSRARDAVLNVNGEIIGGNATSKNGRGDKESIEKMYFVQNPTILLLGVIGVALSLNRNEKRTLQPLPLSRNGRWIVDANGNRVPFVGINWPGAADTMLPEGLQYQSISDIVGKVVETGFNVVRLTFAVEMVDDILDNGGDVGIGESLERALGTENGTLVLAQILSNNPSLSETTTRLEVFDDVATELAAQNIYLHLDNHVSKAMWCCSLTDGNSWFGDTYFNTTKWVRALSYMADHGKSNWPTFTSIGLRNELRLPLTSIPTLASYTWSTWDSYMTLAASSVYTANPSLLIFFSGLDSDFNVAPALAGSTLLDPPFQFDISSYAWANKFILELHEYDEGISSDCAIYEKILDGFGADATSDEEGNGPAPLVISEWGGSTGDSDSAYGGSYVECLSNLMVEREWGWMVWVLAGSYYIREGEQDYDETYGLLDHTWTNYRGTNSSNFIKQLVQDAYTAYE